MQLQWVFNTFKFQQLRGSDSLPEIFELKNYLIIREG